MKTLSININDFHDHTNTFHKQVYEFCNSLLPDDSITKVDNNAYIQQENYKDTIHLINMSDEDKIWMNNCYTNIYNYINTHFKFDNNTNINATTTTTTTNNNNNNNTNDIILTNEDSGATITTTKIYNTNNFEMRNIQFQSKDLLSTMNASIGKGKYIYNIYIYNIYI
jgi:hypothetical protein